MIKKNESTELSFKILDTSQSKISVYQPKGTGKILAKILIIKNKFQFLWAKK